MLAEQVDQALFVVEQPIREERLRRLLGNFLGVSRAGEQLRHPRGRADLPGHRLGFQNVASDLVSLVLPALLVGAALALGMFVAVNLASEALLRSETIVWIPGNGDQGMPGQVDWRVVDYRLLSPEGEILTWNEAYQRYGDVGVLGEEIPPGADVPPGVMALRSVLFVNPGDLYPLVAARMAVLYAAIGFGSIVLAFAVIDRRRP